MKRTFLNWRWWAVLVSLWWALFPLAFISFILTYGPNALESIARLARAASARFEDAVAPLTGAIFGWAQHRH